MTTTTARFSLGELLDRVLDAGLVAAGDIVIGLADIDLVLINLRALVTGVESARRRAGLPTDALPDRGSFSKNSSNSDRDVASIPELPGRFDLDDQRSEHGVAGIVLLVVEILRELVESQALARLEGGSLTEAEIERLGQALRALDQRLTALREWLKRPLSEIAPKEGQGPWQP
jgi:hypothetical protein